MLKLSRIAKKDNRLVIGLISGTSADGVDAALVRVEGAGCGCRVEVLAWDTFPYDPEVRNEVLALAQGAACDAGRISDLNFRLGHVFADAGARLCGKAGADMGEIDLIGSHGQTVFHRGAGREPDVPSSTLQLAEPCVIAERTGVTTVADFRPRDMAVGGQGAPLVPLADYILFVSETKSRCMLNIGGIANVTLLPKGCALEDVLAFDTGPGNMVLDSLAKIFSGGERTYDEGGALALKGKANKRLLEKLLAHRYFRLKPPKSTGREVFGESYVRELLELGGRLGLTEADLLMSAVSLTARTIGDACRRHFPKDLRLDEAIVGGGGVHNEALMKSLRKELKPAKVKTSDELGVAADAKEAVAFALLANETVCGHAGNIPSATGASKWVVLGKIIP